MPKRKECPVCPYCKKEASASKAIGTSGLINSNGMSVNLVCKKCEKDFECEIEVTIKYSTAKT